MRGQRLSCNMTSAKKTCSIFFISILVPTVCCSRIGGVISGALRLNRSSSPYVISSDLVVDQSSTLTIDPGAELQFFSGVGLKVNGTLVAKGNVIFPI